MDINLILVTAAIQALVVVAPVVMMRDRRSRAKWLHFTTGAFTAVTIIMAAGIMNKQEMFDRSNDDGSLYLLMLLSLIWLVLFINIDNSRRKLIG